MPTLIPGLKNVKKISAISTQTTVLLENGDILTWGQSLYGQTDGTYKTISNPVKVEGISMAKDIAAGQGFSLILGSDGTIYGFGSNRNRQLATTSASTFSTPIIIEKWENSKHVVAGNDHSIVVLEDGSLKTWGRNIESQLGDGTQIGRSVPVNVLNDDKSTFNLNQTK